MRTHVRQVIKTWSFDHVVRRLVNVKGWCSKLARQVESEYRKYLLILAANPNQLHPVPELVDEFGHTHLLFTQDAQAFEEATSMRLEHTPFQDPSEAKDLMTSYHELTLAQIKKMTDGPLNSAIWTPHTCVCTWRYLDGVAGRPACPVHSAVATT